MRLLNVETLQLSEFVGENQPHYAILSHTWEEDEVNFAEFVEERGRDRHGYAKIEALCHLAKERQIDWVWIDTCCVDKRSSAELSETINSIFRWYQQATECYALLSDVCPPGDGDERIEMFRKSRWFTRGWTLPELLAPRSVIFFDATWEVIGHRSAPEHATELSDKLSDITDWHRLNLTREIEAITGIPRRYLDGEPLSNASVDEKINWVRKRQTTRIEDMAYCLLGIFGLSMDLRYGEGTRAFVRLRDEIIRWENDDLPMTVSSGIDPIEILRLPRRRTGRGRGAGNRPTYGLASSFEMQTIEPRLTTTPSHVTANLDNFSQARAPSTPANASAIPSIHTKATRRLSLPVCWIIIILGSLMVSGSLAIGLFFSIAKDQMGDGFTLAGWIIAVGTLTLAIPITAHYPQCRCWKNVGRGILDSS